MECFTVPRWLHVPLHAVPVENQNMKSKFLHYRNYYGKEITKRCSWLKNQSTAKKDKLCNKDLKGLYPSALEACPIICGQVGCE